MIKWQDVVEGTETLEEVITEVRCLLTVQQWVVLHEVIQEYTTGRDVDPRVYEIVKNIPFEFHQKGGGSGEEPVPTGES